MSLWILLDLIDDLVFLMEELIGCDFLCENGLD
jgi:hypothetical protein